MWGSKWATTSKFLQDKILFVTKHNFWYILKVSAGRNLEIVKCRDRAGRLGEQARSQRGGQAGMSPPSGPKKFFCPYIIVVWMGFDRDLSDNSYELSVSRVKIVHTKKQNTKLYTLYAHGGRRRFDDLILMWWNDRCQMLAHCGRPEENGSSLFCLTDTQPYSN